MRRIGLLFVLWSRFKDEAKMVWAMLRDPRAPFVAKMIAVLALAYLASPVDFISDFVPILGWVDDGLVLAGLLWLAYQFLPRDLYEALRRRAGATSRSNVIEGEAQRVA
ncbi:MAG TPA: DUF1232 domain-containing protein [Burkholderiales bacterium]|nr:DUF1232 domain-containing protein [Burkholderiales bacterium]